MLENLLIATGLTLGSFYGALLVGAIFKYLVCKKRDDV